MSEPSKPTGLWAYAESMQSAHEAYVRKHSAVLPVYEYDPADDGPEVEVIRLANANRTLRAKAKLLLTVWGRSQGKENGARMKLTEEFLNKVGIAMQHRTVDNETIRNVLLAVNSIAHSGENETKPKPSKRIA